MGAGVEDGVPTSWPLDGGCELGCFGPDAAGLDASGSSLAAIGSLAGVDSEFVGGVAIGAA